MTVAKQPVESPRKFYYSPATTDSGAEAKAKAKFTTAEWGRLDETTKAAIVSSLTPKRSKLEITDELVEDMTAFLKENKEQWDSTFESSRKGP